MKFVNAGHCYPVHVHESEISFLKTKPNFVLGGMDDIVYKEHSVTLAPVTACLFIPMA